MVLTRQVNVCSIYSTKAEVRYVNEYIGGLLPLFTFSKKYISLVVIKFHVKHI